MPRTSNVLPAPASMLDHTQDDQRRIVAPMAPVGAPLMKFRSHWKAWIAAFFCELLGTFLFLFLAFFSVQGMIEKMKIDGSETSGVTLLVKQFYISISFAVSLMVSIFLFCRISGGLFNPAVTLAFCVMGLQGWLKGIALIFAQVLGGVIAAAVVAAITPGSLDIGNDAIELGQGSAFVLECFLTAALLLVIFLVASEDDHPSGALAPVGIGGVLFIDHMVGASYSGASMNPARSFGPALVNGNFPKFHWIYWIGPMVGALAACGIFSCLRGLGTELADDKAIEKKSSRENSISSSGGSV